VGLSAPVSLRSYLYFYNLYAYLLTTAVDRRSDSIRSGGPTRSSADFSVPRQRFHAAPGLP